MNACKVRCRPSEQLFPGQDGVVCSFVLCDKTLSVYPTLKLKVFVVEIKPCKGQNLEVLQAVPRVVCKLKNVIQQT